MTTIVLFRHGKAAPRSDYNRDADRPLTDHGIEKTGRCARGLSRLVELDCILTSPLVRARQTAEIVCREQSGLERVQQVEELACGVDPEAVARVVKRSGGRCVALVGHEPDMSDLASWMISRGDDVAIHFKKAAACCITFDGSVVAGMGTLQWFIPSKALAAIAD